MPPSPFFPWLPTPNAILLYQLSYLLSFVSWFLSSPDLSVLECPGLGLLSFLHSPLHSVSWLYISQRTSPACHLCCFHLCQAIILSPLAVSLVSLCPPSPTHRPLSPQWSAWLFDSAGDSLISSSRALPFFLLSAAVPASLMFCSREAAPA